MIARAIHKYFQYQYEQVLPKILDYETVQNRLITAIIAQNLRTDYLQKYEVSDLDSFQKNLPLASYDDLEPSILHIKERKRNALTTAQIIAFSKSSGTASRSKWIPQSRETIESNYLGGKTMLALYLHHFSDSTITQGVNFSLTGSYKKENGYVVGDVSALMAHYLPFYFRFFRVPKEEIALIEHWDEKIEKLLPVLAKSDIRWIAGVPSWIKYVAEQLQIHAQKPILDVWKYLEVFFYGGTDIAIYRQSLDALFEGKVKYWQIYNASEGFFGVQWDKTSPDMALLPHLGTYYEFLDTQTRQILTAKELEIGKIYELILTNNAGLWRYRIGDLVEITGENPLRIKVAGRTKDFINAFGEELMIHNVEMALKMLAETMDFEMEEYTIAPELDENKTGFHHWLVAFKKPPESLKVFENELDKILQELNSDYAAKRSQNRVMKNLNITEIPLESFKQWLQTHRRLSAQSKIPRMAQDNNVLKEICALHVLSRSQSV